MRNTLCLLFIVWGLQTQAQSTKILPKNINNPAHNSVYPVVSGDGKVMLFMSDYSDDGSFVMNISYYRAGKWQDPEELDVLGSSSVNNWGGYSLNYDGSIIYFSSRRSDGVGQFDIWYSTNNDGVWSRPKNFGKPVNSSGNEGNPTLSSDNQRIYFMRCERMSTSKAEGCNLYFSERTARGWKEPEPLPEYLNIGNTTSPRILPDNRTLVFASDRPGGKGKIDLWQTKRTGDHWREPVNLKPLNTPENDLFMSATMRSIAFITTLSDRGNKAVAEVRMPKEYRLDNVIIQQGTVKDTEGTPLAADVRAYNLVNQTYETRIRTSSKDGKFIMILPQGAEYDVAFNEIRLTKLYYSELVDATELMAPRREYPNIILPDLEKGAIFSLNALKFKPFSAEIDETISSLELSRLIRLLKHYPALQIEIGAYQKEYIEDKALLDDDLTEIRSDTLVAYEPAIRVDTMATHMKDSLLIVLNDSLAATVQDTLLANTYLDRMAAIDSVEVKKIVNIYHNNRTPAQAEALKEKLVIEGIDESRITAVGYQDNEPPVGFPHGFDRMVVIKFLNDPKE